MNLQTMRNRVYIHTRDFKRERFDPLLIDKLLNEAQEEFSAQTKLFRSSEDLTADARGTADLVTSVVGGQVTGVTITNGGSGYTTAPAVTFGAPDTGGVTATGQAVLENGVVINVIITNPGSKYLSAPTVTIADVPGSPPAGTRATATCTVSQYSAQPLQGDILRIEDLGTALVPLVPPVALVRTSEEALDVLVGPSWRTNASGSPQFYMRGKGGKQYAGTADGTAAFTGYEAITIYPLVADRKIRVWFVKTPPELLGDYDSSPLPGQYHMALVWHAVTTLLSESSADGDAAKAQQASARYQEFLRRATEEADQSLRWR